MVFTKRLRAPIMRGEVTCSVRIWRAPHVTLADVTPELARLSGFLGVVDLLKVAKHGPGENVYLIEFEYHADATKAGAKRSPG
jgi:hypothetical protein